MAEINDSDIELESDDEEFIDNLSWDTTSNDDEDSDVDERFLEEIDAATEQSQELYALRMMKQGLVNQLMHSYQRCYLEDY